jgi:hypothetical protein
MKKILAIIIVLIMFSNTLAVTASIDLNNEHELSIACIEASSPYEYGLKAGRLLRSQYRLIDLLARFSKKSDITTKDIKDQINHMENYYPFILEEFKGLSASLNIKLERLLFLQEFLRHNFGLSCTTTLSTGPATKYNETFLTQNADSGVRDLGDVLFTIIDRILSYKCWVIKINTLRYKYMCFGIPVLHETPLMNEKGLGFGGNLIRLTKNESRYVDEGPGMSWENLAKLSIMTCKNVSEVATLWKNMERCSEANKWNVISAVWCDGEGGILCIEYTHNHIITVFGNSTEITGAPEDILWHASHHQWLDPNLTGSVFPEEYPSSALREERSRELLEDNYGNITLDVCKSICRDHGGGFDSNVKDSGDICRHPDKNDRILTRLSWIIQPKDLTIYFAHRSPCRSIFWRYDLSKKLETTFIKYYI